MKTITKLLVFALTISIIALPTSTGTAFDTEITETPALSAKDIPEIIANEVIAENRHVSRLREQETELSTVAFKNDDGTNTLYFFGEPVKYIAEDGSVQDKSNKLYSDFKTDNTTFRNKSKYAYANLDNDVKAYFPQCLDSETGVMLTAPNGINIELLPIAESSENSAKARTETRSGETDKVYYDGVFGKNTALRYEPTFSGYKEDIVLYENIGNEFKFLLKPNGLKAEVIDKQINLIDTNTGETAVEISPIFVYDSAEFPNFTFDNEMKLTPLDDGDYEILVVVDKEYLASKETVYPVYVDPTVEFQPGGTGANKTIQDLTIGMDGSGTTPALNSVTSFIGYSVSGSYSAYWKELMRFPGMMNDPVIKALHPNAITNATLRLYRVTGSNNTTITPYYYTGNKNWVETAPNNHGAVYSGTTGAAINSAVSVQSITNIPITNAVKAWKNDSSGDKTKQGLVLVNNNLNGTSYLQTFYSTNSTSNKPYVEVTYKAWELKHFTRTTSGSNLTITGLTQDGIDFLTTTMGGVLIIPTTLNGLTVKEIGESAFNFAEKGYVINSVIIPNGVTHIRSSAFTETAITSVTIPASVAFIYPGAFIGCANLTSVTFMRASPHNTFLEHTYADYPLGGVTYRIKTGVFSVSCTPSYPIPGFEIPSNIRNVTVPPGMINDYRSELQYDGLNTDQISFSTIQY